MFTFKKAISPVIAVILLLAITVVISMGMYSFLENYTQSTTNSLSSNSIQGNLQIKHIFADNLFLQSEENVNLSLLRVSDSNGNELCSFSGNTEVDSTGLVGHWTFDEMLNNGTHNYAPDLSGLNNHAYVKNNTFLPVVVESNLGNAFRFDGKDDYLEVFNYSSFNLIDNFSIFLISTHYTYDNDLGNSGGFQRGGGISKGWIYGAPNSYDYSINFIGDKVDFRISNSSHHTTASNLNPSFPDDYFFEAFSLNQNTIISMKNENTANLIVNNKVSSTALLSAEMSSSNETLIFGGRKGFDFTMNGEIDEIRIYNRTLSEEEIETLYWYSIKNQQSGSSQLDLSSCNLQRNKQYKITMIVNGDKIESTQIMS